MQVDYSKGRKVSIKKPGHFNGMIGTIKSIKLEIDFGFSIGTWSFSDGELELVEGGNEIAPLNKKERETLKKAFTTPDEAVFEAVKEAVEKATGKRAYTKRASKPKEVAQKRKYTHKTKEL
jgi:hypothetical protein